MIINLIVNQIIRYWSFCSDYDISLVDCRLFIFFRAIVPWAAIPHFYSVFFSIPVIRLTRRPIVVLPWFAIRPFPVIAAGAVLLTNWCLWSGFSLASKPAAILCQRKDISIFYIILHWCNMSTPLSSKLIMFFPIQRLRVVFALWMF